MRECLRDDGCGLAYVPPHQGRTTLAVTHDVEMALRADRVVWLEDGQILREGAPRTLLAEDPTFREWVEASGRTPDEIRVNR